MFARFHFNVLCILLIKYHRQPKMNVYVVDDRHCINATATSTQVPWYFKRCRQPFLIAWPYQQCWFELNDSQINFVENTCDCVVITAPADGLAPVRDRASARRVMTKFGTLGSLEGQFHLDKVILKYFADLCRISYISCGIFYTILAWCLHCNVRIM